MAALVAFRAGLREVVFLGAARKTVDDYGADRLERIRGKKRLAKACRRASRKLADPYAAVDLLDDAVASANEAAILSGQSPMSATHTDAYEMGFADAERLRDEIDLALTQALSQVESRTGTELQGLVVGRITAAVIAAFLVVHALTGLWGTHNVALHKPVVTSALHPPPATGEGIVDGRTRGTFGVQTVEGHPAFITIDLMRTYRIRRVRVYNRGDGWFDESLPLTLDVSDDGLAFHEVARRNEHFEVWTVDLDAVDARYVRVSKDNGYIALNEIEVYARD